MTKAALEALVNALLAPNQPITANGQHKPSMQKVIDELYDAQSRGVVLNGLTEVLSLLDNDKVMIFRSGGAVKADKNLIGGVGTGVTDGNKVGVQVSGTGTIWLPSDYISTTVNTASSTITLNLNSKYEGRFTGLSSFATPKTVVRTNETRAQQWIFMFEVTSTAATVDFGENTRVSSNMTSGVFVAGVFTPLDVGAYKVVATRRYDDIWWLDFKGVYSVGDAPPTPDPTLNVIYDNADEVFYDNGNNVQYVG
jgi:hypothetical protein